MAQAQAAEVRERRLLPLTAAQRGLWFAETLSPDYSVNIAQYVDIRHEPGGLDIDLLVQCCYDVGKLVESPYIRLVEVDGVPMQYVDVDYDQRVDVVDLRDADDPVATAQDWMRREYRRPVDLLNDQLIVTTMLLVGEDRTFWYGRAHHIIVDGYAALGIVRRTVDRYNALRRGDEPTEKAPAGMAEIVEYEDAYRTSARRVSDREHWLERVADLPEGVTLARHKVKAPLSFDNIVAGHELDATLQTRIDELAREANSSIAVVLTAAFGAFLARMSDADDIVMSLPVTGRATARIRTAGGMVSNALPVRLRRVREQTGRELVAAAQLELMGALRHQRYRSDDIRRDAGFDASSVTFGPTINMVFFDDEVAIDGTTMEYRILTSGILEDLLINLYQASPGAPVVVDLHGNPHLYSSTQMHDHLERFLIFVERFVADLDVRVDDVDVLRPVEHTALADLETGGPGPVFAPDADLLDGFTGQVRDHPDRIAIIEGERHWTYGEFDLLRRVLATWIARNGVVAGDRVAVVLPRGIDQVAAIYATLTLGAAYVPVDPDQPAARRRSVLDTAAPRLVVDAAFLETVFGEDPRFDAVDPQEVDAPDRFRRYPSGHAAYVLFTSGSTGVPKGVEVSHEAVLNRLAWVQEHFPFTADDAFLYKTPTTFDVSVPELFWPLQVGARMVIARPGGHRDPDHLRQLIESESITAVHFVPSMLEVFVDAVEESTALVPPTLRRIITSGEALSPALAQRVLDRADITLINLYGPTEAAVDVTEYVVERDVPIIPIGRPVPGTELRVLDANLRRVPVGVPGELYLSGVQLAHGYLGAPARTAERFVADPFATGRRMYRTGDLARWDADGRLDYLGRTDFQVKIRGQRVEPGEIEAVLLGDPCIDHAVVVVRADGPSPAVIGYVKCAGAPSDSATPHTDSPGTDFPHTDVPHTEALVDRLLRACRKQLPSHMVPASIVVLEKFPTTVTGKLDRTALPAPAARSHTSVYQAPRTAAEVAVVRLLEDLLGVGRISLSDNIFALGADSLTAARLVARARSGPGLAITLADVFDSATVADLASTATPRGADEHPPLTPMPRPERIPLSHPQTRLWLINRMDPSSGVYNMPGALRLGPAVDTAAVRAALRDVLDRHEALRTIFPEGSGEPHQLITPTAQVDLDADQVFAVTDVAPDALAATIGDAAAAGFDLVADHPTRVRLLRVVDAAGTVTDHVLVVVLHHIVGDGASLAPLIADLSTAYAARSAGHAPQWRPLPVQYADYALWHRDLLGDITDEQSLLRRQLTFWQDELDGLPAFVSLPTDRPRPATGSGRGAHLDVDLDLETSSAIRALASVQGVTTFAVFQSALAAVMSRFVGSGEVPIGTAVSGRDDPRLADLVGMFVNTVILRTTVDPADTVGGLLRRAHRVRARALGNADVPFEQVVTALGVRTSRSHAPLFGVELVMQGDHLGRLLGGRPTGARPAGDRGPADAVIDARVPAAKYDLSVHVADPRGSAAATPISIEFTYASDLFEEATIARFADGLIAVLRGMAQADVDAVGVADLLRCSADELAPIREWSHGAATDMPATTLPDLIAAAVAAAGDRPALIAGDRVVDYAEFGSRVNGLARDLIAAGIGPDDTVAVAIDRSAELLVAIHAVVAAGGAYLPVAVDTPVERAQYMVRTGGVRHLLVAAGHTPGFADALGPAVAVTPVDTAIPIETVTARGAAPVTDADRHAPLRTDDAAYTLFTSGSTGRPKGVTVSHAAIGNRLRWMQDAHRLTADDVVLQKTPVTFDVSLWELFWPLMTGSTLVIAEPNRHGDPSYLRQVINRHRVSVVHFVPSMLSAFLDALDTVEFASMESVRLMFTSGEALPARVAAAVLRGLPTTRLHNLYGPTEAAVDVTAHEVVAGETVVPIGRPVANTTTHVLGPRLEPVPQGVPGELYLGGVQLARGYAAQGGLTAERFVADPFGSDGARLYRTGDLVRWNSAGELEYLGRNDFQVKLRGRRLELGEIEAALVAVPGVVHAAATVVDLSAGQSLVAYYAPDTTPPATVARTLAEHLPDFMVPTIWMPLPAIPLNAAGKVDRKALPEPVITVAETVAPSTDTEQIVARVYAEVLGADHVSVTESFFDLGGNSLSATKLAARLSAELEYDITVAAIFAAPSVRELCDHAARLHRHRRRRLEPADHDGVAPLSTVQRGMWLINHADPDSPAYNVAMALHLSGALDRDAISAAVEDVIARHHALRTHYPMVDGDPIQTVLDTATALERIERRMDEQGHGDPAAAIAAFTGRGFDVTASPPVRVLLLATGSDEHVLVAVVHHIAADGISMGPLARDLMSAYASRVGGVPPNWSDMPVDYLDFTLWQQEILAGTDDDGNSEAQRQLAYWTQRLAGTPARLELPTDRPRPRTPSFTGGAVDFDLDPDLVAGLEVVARGHNATLFMVMQAAFALLLSRLTTQRDIVIGTPHAGRGEAELDDVVGMFVNTLALRTQIRDDEKFAEMLHRVREDDLADMACADIAFDTIADAVLTSRPTSHNPIYQVMFAFQNFTFPTVTLDGLTVTPLSEELTAAKVDLQLTLYPPQPAPRAVQDEIPQEEPAMKAQMIYAADLFRRETVELYTRRYLRVLEDIAENPQVLVGDISVTTAEEDAAAGEGSDDIAALPLPQLVDLAAQVAPESGAVGRDAVPVTFTAIAAMTTAMAAVLPDRDSALTTALMSLIPTLAADGPAALGEVLEAIRSTATEVVAGGNRTQVREGTTQT
ncbi:amino acid adenylation domain-containing protein [Gordonia desulfuricans]|uniref:Amino acid adenylation domain-containing protein n=2 Tax=Gordonia desulfuricans TaxID=89051 RepID=A0A7K3LV69_9ACTN|nr:amino acid adenylation domain-containing protein [Gordonia desulfuricans]